jgi:lysozyme
MFLNTRENQLGWCGYLENKYPVHFVFIRHREWPIDKQFDENWRGAKKQPYPGAYHYYRPNENSLEQALFIKTVSLKRDLPGFRYWKTAWKPVVDRLKIGLKDGW